MNTKQKMILDLALRLDKEFNSPFPTLEEVAKKYLNLSSATASRQANEGELPFVAFSVADSKKSQKCVSTNDLAEYLLSRNTAAKNDFIKLREVKLIS